MFVDDPLSSLEQEILLYRHNNIQKYQQGSSIVFRRRTVGPTHTRTYATELTLTDVAVLGCVEEEPAEYHRLQDDVAECAALRYNSLDSGVPAEYDDDEVANSINTTLNRSSILRP